MEERLKDRRYTYFLLQTNCMTSATKLRVLEYFGNSFNLYVASPGELFACPFITKKIGEAFLYEKKNNNLDKVYLEFTQSPFSFVTIEEDEYPASLRNIDDAPFGIYYIGKLPKDEKKCIAMVGARTCSAYGKKMAQELSSALAQKGFCVVSGMARGIDAFSHRGAIMVGGESVAVLGGGIDVVYPQQNQDIYEYLAQNGCIISEQKPGTQPLPAYFPLRNRIISALSHKIIVVEARSKSGSLITAEYALDQGKDVYAIPGRAGDDLSSGCNKLIAQGAGIICSTDYFLKEVCDLTMENSVILNKNNGKEISLEKDELLVYSCLDMYPKGLSAVQQELNMDYLALLGSVIGLMKKGLIKEVFKNQFVIA